MTLAMLGATLLLVGAFVLRSLVLPTVSACASSRTAPSRAIDRVLAPAGWMLLERRTLGGTLSDHRALLCVLELPDAR